METSKRLFFLFSFLFLSSFLFGQSIGANQIKIDNATIKGNATNQLQVDTAVNKIASQHFVLTHGGTGTVTSVATGFGLSGGPITTSGTLLVDTAANKIATQFYARAHAGSGTVTSVALSTPTGLSISGSPITSSGTLALSLTSGYAIPTTANISTWNSLVTMTYPGAGIPLSTGSAWSTSITDNSSNWNTAYGWGNHASAGYYVGTSSTIRGLFSNTATGLTYNSTTGATSLTSGYVIPTTTEETNWNTAYGWGNHASAGYYVGTSSTIRGLLSFTTGSGAYNSTTGVITIPTNNNELTNGAGYITGNQSITLSGDISGSGTTAITTAIGNLKVTNAMIANTTIDLTAKVTGVLPTANGGMDPSMYHPILRSAGTITAAVTAGTYMMMAGSNSVLASATSSAVMPGVIYISSSDYPTVNGLAPKLRIRAGIFVNATAPTGNFTFGLYPVTSPGSAGAAGNHIWTVGSLVSGSNGATQSTPAANTFYNLTSSDFALPANGWYVICVVTTGTIATSSYVQMNADLQIHNQ